MIESFCIVRSAYNMVNEVKMKYVHCFCFLTCLLLPAFAAAQSNKAVVESACTEPVERTDTLSVTPHGRLSVVRAVVQEKISPLTGREMGRKSLLKKWRPKPILRHAFRISAGALPISVDRGLADEGKRSFTNPLDQMDATFTYRGTEYTTGAFSLFYGYRLARCWEAGISVSYSGLSRRKYHVADGSPLGRRQEHYWTAMPFVRLFWMDRALVRLYSGLGVGFQWKHARDYNGHQSGKGQVGLHFTALGISVGRRLFGFAEVGAGAHGLMAAGIGYRFDAGK